VYEMIVGEPPFIGAPRKVLTAQRHQYPLPPSDRVEGVPAELELWCLRLLAKRPEERFATAADAHAALPPPPAAYDLTPPDGFPSEARFTKTPSGLHRARSGNHAAMPRRLPLYGRELERAQLARLLEGA